MKRFLNVTDATNGKAFSIFVDHIVSIQYDDDETYVTTVAYEISVIEKYEDIMKTLITMQD
jgi:hypothetical protein